MILSYKKIEDYSKRIELIILHFYLIRNVNEITYRFQLVLFLFNFLKKEFRSSQADQKRKICKVFKTWKI